MISIIADAAGSLLIRYLYDGDWTRFFLVITLPAAALLASFPATVLVTAFVSSLTTVICCQLDENIDDQVYIFGPISHYNKNSYFYSAVKPDRSNPPEELPSITIQMPVYKVSRVLTWVSPFNRPMIDQTGGPGRRH